MTRSPVPTVEVEDIHVTYEVYEDRTQGLKQLFAAGKWRREARRVHAVRGVTFNVYEGETLGIVGSNGSGKSTVLAAMTGLLPLDSGDIRVRSRPALLGVSAALRASLSGRRNILIGCLALGLRPAEIDERIDEIIDFAGLREFIDLPMRSYSSGMKARLNFAIASAATPSILLIDEALAVGDEAFRRRSQERIDEIRRAAGSVVLVSHNLSEIERACDRAIWLDKGVLRAEGRPDEVVASYLASDQVAARPEDATPTRKATSLRSNQTRRDRRAILHIGVATAGDTALQTDLHARRGEIFAAGYTYPTFFGGHDHRPLADYGLNVGGDMGAHQKSWSDEFRTSFLRATRSGGDLVTTSVALARIPHVEGCEQIAALLNEAGFETIEVVLFVRRQDECASISHLRDVCRGRTAPFDVAEHLEKRTWYDFEAVATRWSSVAAVSDVHVRLHRDRAKMRSNAERFAELAGIPGPDGDDDWRDVDLDPRQVALLRAFNSELDDRSDVDRFAWLLRRRASRSDIGLLPGEAEQMLETFAKSNQKVLERVPAVERIEDYFSRSRVVGAAELNHSEADIWALLVDLAGHASLLRRRLKRLERES